MTRKPNGTLSLALNSIGMYMILNSLPMTTTNFHFQYTPMLIWYKHMMSIRNQAIQEYLSNGGIGCVPRKYKFGTNYQKQLKQPFWVILKHPISLLLMSNFIIFTLFVLSRIVPINFIFLAPLITHPTLIEMKKILLMAVEIILWY